MKNSIVRLTLLTYLLIQVLSCAPTSQQIKESVDKDPSIVFSIIEKYPDQFMESVVKAQQTAQAKAQEKANLEEKQQRENELKNPLKPNIDEKRVIFGSKDAKVTIVEYSDFQCPYCSRGYQVMNQVKKTYGNKVRIVFKHLPLDFHPLAMPAARYFEAIGLQSAQKAEKFHDLVFQNQDKLKGESYLNDLAKKAGANMTQLAAALKTNTAIQDRIDSDIAEAKSFNMSGTPGFIINGVSLRGAYPFESFKEIIDQQLTR